MEAGKEFPGQMALSIDTPEVEPTPKVIRINTRKPESFQDHLPKVPSIEKRRKIHYFPAGFPIVVKTEGAHYQWGRLITDFGYDRKTFEDPVVTRGSVPYAKRPIKRYEVIIGETLKIEPLTWTQYKTLLDKARDKGIESILFGDEHQVQQVISYPRDKRTFFFTNTKPFKRPIPQELRASSQ